MKNFFIIANKQKPKALPLANYIKDYLSARNANAIIAKDHKVSYPYLYTDPNKIPKDIECILAIGGDGTLIRAARDVVDLEIPLIGVNSGRLGFLAEIEEEFIDEGLDKLLNDDFYIEKRLRLTCSKESDKENSFTALNDIVVLKETMSGILGIRIFVNGQHINDYNADGIIVSTPTGSTGYSLSAGGPIVEPIGDMIIITPINPHTLHSRSIVISGDSDIKVELFYRQGTDLKTGNITCDGEVMSKLHIDDSLTIKGSDTPTRIIKLSKDSFFKIIRNKMRDV